MKIIEYVERFARTMLDFWRLHPRDFLAAAKRDRSSYLSPYEFLVVFLSVGLAIYSASFSLVFWALRDEAADVSLPPTQALAIRTLSLIVVLVVIGAIANRAISRIWPLRGCATFEDILAFRLYELSTLIPIMVLDLIVAPPLAAFVADDLVSQLVLGLVLLAGLAFAAVSAIVKSVPGLAAVNRVSPARAWAAIVFWSTVPSIVLGIVFFVVSMGHLAGQMSQVTVLSNLPAFAGPF